MNTTCAKTPTEQKLPTFQAPCVLVRDAKVDKTCTQCNRPMISAGPVCGRCDPPKLFTDQLPTDRKGENGRRELPWEEGFQNETPLSKAVDVSAFTSGFAAGMMMAQLDFCHRMTYRKPNVQIVDTGNARTTRFCHCGKCTRGRCGLCERKHA